MTAPALDSAASSGVVLVTGGTGSFGSTMVRRLLAAGTPEVRVLSRDELKQHELRVALDDPRVKFSLQAACGSLRQEPVIRGSA